MLTPTYEQGTVIEDGRARIEEYIAHRKRMEEEIWQALRDNKKDATSMELVKVVYRDVPENLHVYVQFGIILLSFAPQSNLHDFMRELDCFASEIDITPPPVASKEQR